MSEKKKYPSRKDLIAVEKQKSLQSEHVGCSDDGESTYLIENLPNGVRNFEELASTGAKVFSMPDLNNGFLSQNEGLISFDNYFADNGVDECDNSHELTDEGSVDSVELDNADTLQTSSSDQYKGLKEKNISPDSENESDHKNDITIQNTAPTKTPKRDRKRNRNPDFNNDVFFDRASGDVSDSGSKSKKSIISKFFLVSLQIVIVVAIPMSGVLSIPISSILFADTYESMLSRISDEHIDSDSQLLNVASANSRFKVIEGAKEQCVPAGSANGDKMINKDFALQWPMLEGSFRLTSPFGYRSDPATGRHVLHSGLDMAAPLGTPIVAIADGKVEKVDVYGGAGRVIIFHEINGVPTQSWYLHMYQNGIFVKEGQHVKKGENIAAVGSSGYSTGPHLHFEIHPYAEDAVDPNRWLIENKAVLVPKEC